MRLAEMVAALSLATDLGTGHPLERALRTCLVAVRLGAYLPLTDSQLQATYYTALLRFVGCTADMNSLSSIFGDEQMAQARVHLIELLPPQMIAEVLRHAGDGYPLSQRIRKIAYGIVNGIQGARESAVAHCEVSQSIAGRLGLKGEVITALGQLFERWDGQGIPGAVRGEAVAFPMRLVQLAQDVELYQRVGGVEAAVEIVQQRKGGAYDPALAELFIRHAPVLLADMAAESVWELVLGNEPGDPLTLPETRWDAVARAIADFTDLRSPYSYGHSANVAELLYRAAERYGLTAHDAVTARRAAYVHEVGRTAVSLRIWDKPGDLTSAEWEKVRLYPYYTERILTRPTAVAVWGKIAGLHRERLDGSGYHRGVPGAMIPPEARLLAAADAYQSKLEPRAYREAWSPAAAATELRAMVRAGQLESAAVEAVLESAGHGETAKRAYPAGLSEREVEVLRLLARGMSNKAIGAQLFISPKTVGHHIQHIYDKVGCSTRAAATLFALQHHLLEPGISKFWK